MTPRVVVTSVDENVSIEEFQKEKIPKIFTHTNILKSK